MTVSALRRLEGMRFPGYPASGASKIVHDRPPRSGLRHDSDRSRHPAQRDSTCDEPADGCDRVIRR